MRFNTVRSDEGKWSFLIAEVFVDKIVPECIGNPNVSKWKNLIVRGHMGGHQSEKNIFKRCLFNYEL